MKMSELVEHVSKKPIPPWTKNLLVEVMVNDENDEDVEVCSENSIRWSRTDEDVPGAVLLGTHLVVSVV